MSSIECELNNCHYHLTINKHFTTQDERDNFEVYIRKCVKKYDDGDVRT